MRSSLCREFPLFNLHRNSTKPVSDQYLTTMNALKFCLLAAICVCKDYAILAGIGSAPVLPLICPSKKIFEPASYSKLPLQLQQVQLFDGPLKLQNNSHMLMASCRCWSLRKMPRLPKMSQGVTSPPAVCKCSSKLGLHVTLPA